MAVEDDMLKTLVRIENLLKASSNSAPSVGGGANARTQRNQRTNQNPNDPKVFKATAASLDSLGDAADNVTKKFGRLGKSIDVTTGRFAQMNRSMRVFARPDTTRVNQQAPANNTAANAATTGLNNLLGSLGGRQGTNLQRAVGGLTNGFSIARISALAFASELRGAITPLLRDMFFLQERGVSAASSLGQLYLDSARAGMSLQEYTEVLENAGPAAMRAANFADFGQRLRETSTQLGRLGVFGGDATKLSATLANAATTLGVPQQRLGESITRQIDVFEELRKSSMITADQFRALSEDLQNNQEVQGELLGLAPAQRAAALQDLTRTRAIGVQMGMTAEASKELGNALIAQRKLTAQQRFQAAGTIRQAGAITGLGAGDSETLARLSRKKNRTAEEDALFTQIGGRLQGQLETMMNSGNIQQEYLAEQLQDRLSASGIGEQLRLSGQARAAQDSGPVVNADVGKNTGKMVQQLGDIFTLLKGIGANPVAGAIISALGSAAFTGALVLGLRGALGPVLTKVLGTGATTRAVAQVAPGAGRAAAGPGVISKTLDASMDFLRKITDVKGLAQSAGRGLSQAGSTLVGGVQAAGTGLMNAARTGAVNILSSFEILKGAGFTPLQAGGKVVMDLTASIGKTLVGGVTSILKGAFGFLGKGGVLSAVFGGVMELFTGDLGNALNTANEKGFFEGGLKGVMTNIVDKVGDIIGGMIRGFATGITGIGDFLIDAWNWSIGSFFDGLKINLGASLTNFFDRSWTDIIIMFKELKAKAAEFFGMTDTAKEIRADIAVAQKAKEALEADGQATLTTVGAANAKATEEQKRLAEQTKKTMDSTAKSVGSAAGVVSSTKGLTQAVVQTAATIATPVTQTRPTVTPPAVNTPTATTTPADATTTTTTSTAPATVTDTLTTQFARIIQLLESNLAAEQLQAQFAEAMVRATGRPVYIDNDTMVNRVAQTT